MGAVPERAEFEGNVVARRVGEYLGGQQEAFVRFLETLAALESPSMEPATLEPVFALLTDALRRLEYHVIRMPGKQTAGYLFARPRQRKRGQACQLVLGHCDTVWPLGTIHRMPVRVEDGLLRGPGVFDMKGGLTQIIFALQALHDLELEPALTPVILFTSDEEIGSPESRRHIERLARVVDRALVPEPSLGLSGKIKTARKGIGEYEVVIKGKPAHAGLEPEKGASAILELSYVVQKLFALNDHPKGISVNVGTVEGGISSNIIAPESRLSVDVRVPTIDDARMIDTAIRTLETTTPGVTLHIDGGINRGPMERTPRNQALWTVCRQVGSLLGLDLEEGASGGASDGNFTSLYTATLDGLGPVGDGAHRFREFIHIEHTLERCALLTLLLLAPPVQG
ncbi:MAG: M20 family metallopeptidase [Rhodothermales bacterium]